MKKRFQHRLNTRRNGLSKYSENGRAIELFEKGNVEQQEEVSSVLGPVKSIENTTRIVNNEKLVESFPASVGGRINLEHSVFNECNMTFNIVSNK